MQNSRGVTFERCNTKGAFAPQYSECYTIHMATMTVSKIRSLVRESVREELSTQTMEIRASLLPLISRSEAANVKRLYKKPSRRAVRIIRATL